MVCTNSLSCCYPHLEKHSITITEKIKKLFYSSYSTSFLHASSSFHYRF
jgi:hypothetical protein